MADLYRASQSARSLGDLPLHGGSIVSSEREQIGVAPCEPHLRHVAAMAEKRRELAALDHRRVAIELNLAIVIGRGDDLLAVGQRSVRPIGVVDVGTVLARLPDALHGPAEHSALRVPDLVGEVRCAASVLDSIWDAVI